MNFVSYLLIRSGVDAETSYNDVFALNSRLAGALGLPATDCRDTHISRLPLHWVVPRVSLDESRLLFARILGQLRLEASRAGKPRWCLIVDGLDDAAWSIDEDERRLCVQLIQSLFSALGPPPWPDDSSAPEPVLPTHIVCVAPVSNAPPSQIRSLFHYEVDVRGKSSLLGADGGRLGPDGSNSVDPAERLLRRQAEHVVALAAAAAAAAVDGSRCVPDADAVFAALQRGSSSTVSAVPPSVAATTGSDGVRVADGGAGTRSAWLSDPANADLFSAPFVRGVWDFTAPAAADAASTYLPRMVPRVGDAAEDAASAAEAAATSSAAIASATSALLARSPPPLPAAIARSVERAHSLVLAAVLSRVAGGRATLRRLGLPGQVPPGATRLGSTAPPAATAAAPLAAFDPFAATAAPAIDTFAAAPAPAIDSFAAAVAAASDESTQVRDSAFARTAVSSFSAAASAAAVPCIGGILLVGPPACGKTTLARHVCALARAASAADAAHDIARAAAIESDVAHSSDSSGVRGVGGGAGHGSAQAAVALTAFVRLADILRSGVGESEAQLQAIFAAARAFASFSAAASVAGAASTRDTAGAGAAGHSDAPSRALAQLGGPAAPPARAIFVFDDAHALFPRRVGSGAGAGGGGGDDDTAKVWRGLAAVMRRCLDDAAQDGVLVIAIAQSEEDVEHTLLAPGRLGTVLRLAA